MSAEQLDLYRQHLSDRARDHGAAGSLWTAGEWSEAAELVLSELIESGNPFTSEDVRIITGPAPSDGAFGALFLRASRAGRIRCVGFERSLRPARHAGAIRVWQAVNAP